MKDLSNLALRQYVAEATGSDPGNIPRKRLLKKARQAQAAARKAVPAATLTELSEINALNRASR